MATVTTNATGSIYATNANIVWLTWATSATADTTSTAAIGDPWQSWIVTGTNATSNVAAGYVQNNGQVVWVTWNANQPTAGVTFAAPTPVPQRELTAEERAEQERKQAEWRAQVEANQRARAEAEKKLEIEKAAARKRAQALLFRELSREHRLEYKHHNRITVVGSDGCTFRIKQGWAGNVEELNPQGSVIARYCIHPREWIPDDDNVLAQKLWLEADAATFRRTANKTLVGA